MSYFQPSADLLDTRRPDICRMVENVADIEFLECESEVDALLKEARLIKDIDRLKKFLASKRTVLIRQMNKQMEEASKSRRYEEAGKIRDRLKAIQSLELSGDGTVTVARTCTSAMIRVGGGNPHAYFYSGLDGTILQNFPGPPGAGEGCSRGGVDFDFDSDADSVVGRRTAGAGAAQAGQAVVYSGLDGSILQSITSRTAGENFGYDALGIGVVNGDGRADVIVTAATGDRRYVIAGEIEPGVGYALDVAHATLAHSRADVTEIDGELDKQEAVRTIG